ncbi:MAG TPA: PPOX class F420-dependent oxidoreductase [Nitrososphaerales archaeon]|nr:PPOX class F420-dependent oxidoreductase [Nitrososphaerales archaeon]
MSSAKQFSTEKYISLETYKKNGEAVRSPVWVVEEGGVVYVRTDPTSWKAKRIRKNPRVRIAPSDMRGRTTSQWVDGQAQFIEEQEANRKIELFKAKYGAGLRFTDFFNGIRGRHATAIISIKLT